MPEEYLYVRGDRDRLKEVLLNLVSNALKHTPRGGIDLLARGASRMPPRGSSSRTRDAASRRKHLPHIFERFYRIRSGSALLDDVIPGTGIGLNICQRDRGGARRHDHARRASWGRGAGSSSTCRYRRRQPPARRYPVSRRRFCYN